MGPLDARRGSSEHLPCAVFMKWQLGVQQVIAHVDLVYCGPNPTFCSKKALNFLHFQLFLLAFQPMRHPFPGNILAHYRHFWRLMGEQGYLHPVLLELMVLLNWSFVSRRPLLDSAWYVLTLRTWCSFAFQVRFYFFCKANIEHSGVGRLWSISPIWVQFCSCHKGSLHNVSYENWADQILLLLFQRMLQHFQSFGGLLLTFHHFLNTPLPLWLMEGNNWGQLLGCPSKCFLLLMPWSLRAGREEGGFGFCRSRGSHGLPTSHLTLLCCHSDTGEMTGAALYTVTGKAISDQTLFSLTGHLLLTLKWDFSGTAGWNWDSSACSFCANMTVYASNSVLIAMASPQTALLLLTMLGNLLT